jgi:hypothetical protein
MVKAELLALQNSAQLGLIPNENSLEAQTANATSPQISTSQEREIGKHRTILEKNLKLQKKCDCDPEDESTIFERISWSYINIGFKRLGL